MADAQPLANVSDDRIAEELPDKPVSSLRDIQYLYGTLKFLVNAGGSGAKIYHSPSVLEHLVPSDAGSSRTVVTVVVDPESQTVEKVELDSYDHETDFGKLGYSNYSASRGVDHSITQKTGKNSTSGKISKYATKTVFKRWASKDTMTAVSDEHDDGWIIEALSEMWESDSENGGDEMEYIRNEIEGSLADNKMEAIITVAVRVDRDDVTLTEYADDGEYVYPGELDVFEMVARERMKQKFIEKNKAENAEGTSTALLSEDKTNVVGMADDPMNYYLGKNTGRFYLLDPDESWRSHPTSAKEAARIRKAGPYLDACHQYSVGANVYFLPYYREMTVSRARDLARFLEAMVEGSVGSVLNADEESDVADSVLAKFYAMDDELRFYTAIINHYQKDKFWQFGDAMNASDIPPIEVASHHAELVQGTGLVGVLSPRFDSQRTLVSSESVDLTDAPFKGHRAEEPDEWRRSLRDDVATGVYFRRTFPDLQDEGSGNPDLGVDDPHATAQRALLSGETLDYEFLVGEYIQRLADDEVGENGSTALMQLKAIEQFVQLAALGRAGLLDGFETDDFAALTNMTEQTTTDSPPEQRRKTFEQFIENNPLLADSPERQGVFALGALVAQVSRYQHKNDVSQRLVDQYPVSSITASRLKRTVADAVGKLSVYSGEEGLSTLMYGELVESLPDHFETADPEDFEMATSDLRFHYALGVAYGMSQSTDNGDSESNDN